MTVIISYQLEVETFCVTQFLKGVIWTMAIAVSLASAFVMWAGPDQRVRNVQNNKIAPQAQTVLSRLDVSVKMCKTERPVW